MAIKIDEEKCTGCGACASVCPTEAINVNEKAKVDEEKCIECSVCIDECPVGAITLE